MKQASRTAIRLLVVMALLLTSVVAFAQDDTDAPLPFVGIRFFDSDNGVLVTGIITNTPAESIDLEAGDMITAIDGNDIYPYSVQEVVWSYSANDTVTLDISRDGDTFEQNITLMERPEDLFSNPLYVIPLDLSAIGLITSQADNDVMVVGTIEGSQAQELGFEVGDILTNVDGDTVESTGEAAVAMSDLSYGDEIIIHGLRDNQRFMFRFIIRDTAEQIRQLDITSSYETENIALGYGEGMIQIQAISTNHDLYNAGLRVNDIITGVNGDAVNALNNLFANDSIDLTVNRDGDVLYFNVPTTVAPLLMFGADAPQAQVAGEWIGLHEKQVTLGVRYIQLETDSPYFADTGISTGAYIAETITGLPAAKAGIQVGDIIVAVDGIETTMDVDLRNRIYAYQPGQKVTLDVLRNGELIQVQVTLRVATS